MEDVLAYKARIDRERESVLDQLAADAQEQDMGLSLPMTAYTALLDANVLYPAPIRDILLQLAVSDVYRAKWSADIHREWIRALLRNEPHRDRASLERTRDLMNQAARDCLVEGYEHLVPALDLPDADDRHVLAAAISWPLRCHHYPEPA